MMRSVMALMLIAILGISLFMIQDTHAAQLSSVTISVDRKTTIYPNYAVSLDTIKVLNGSLTSIIAEFPSNTTILNVSGPDILYAYQLSSSPAREVIVFKNPVTSGASTKIIYIYTGFINSGQLEVAFQAGYSVASVNDTATYYYGIENWGITLQIFYNDHYLNVTQGELFSFNGTTSPNSFVEATNPPTTSMPTLYQSYLEALNSQIVYSNGVFHINDQAIFVWASSSESNQLYLLMPNSVVNKSVSVSYFYGNVSLTIKHDAYPGYALLVINSPVQLSRNQMVGLQIDYSIKAQELNLSSIGLYGMFCETYDVEVANIIPISGSWSKINKDYFAAFREVTPTEISGYSVKGTSVLDLTSGASLAVLIVGLFAVASSYTYAQTKSKKASKRGAPQKVIATLNSASSSIDLAHETIKKFLEGRIRASAANAALATFDDLERKVLREINESVGNNEIDTETARRLTESLKEIRTSFADLIDLQTQFNQKKIRQNIYGDLRSKYQRNLQRAINSFKETTNDLRQS
ncbi:hypothetical protein B9Q09_00695 [Candidatus Marsarchaeota G2 archaeon ECH_B_SAG-C16]|uniref:Uncharacterized protein n=1 Tax=Candidatus Marsarchaeota G2 archaeon ECH_B_SAG-C16 TaxID=1978163 RepID=A0A2R6BFL1_9ARCH|nr:MAG: hypothetical protein B9Q09_00695 [Candidatus Marsarchaeota G2 archaeon ECH_B_SAG-C16]